jgi:hypothetical protein
MEMGRAKVAMYIALANIGVIVGMVISINIPDKVFLFGTGGFIMLIAVIFHFMTQKFVGYYFSIIFNSFALGLMFSGIFVQLDIQTSILNIIAASLISATTISGLVLLFAMQDDFKLGGFISIVSIIIIYIFITNRVMVVGGAFYATLFAINHIGVFYFFSMMIAGEKTNEILRYCSFSSFSLFAVAGIVAVIIMAAYASSEADIDLDFGIGSKSKSSSSKGGIPKTLSHHSNHHHHHSTIGDALFYSSVGSNNNQRKSTRNDVPTNDVPAPEQEVYPNELSDKTVSNEVYPTDSKTNKKDFDPNEWDY